MRLLVVIDSLAVGGAEQSLLETAPHLMARGVDLHVAYLSQRDGIGPQLEKIGAVLHPLMGDGGRPSAVLRTRRLVRSLRPDLVHTTLFEADVVGRIGARLGGVPVVSSFVTESYGREHYGNPEYREWKVRAAHLMDAATARLVTRFHAVSHSAADVMSRRLRVRRDKIVVIPRGRDPEQLGRRTAERRRAARAELGVADDVPVVFAAGRHFHLKGLDLLVSAMPNVRSVFPKARLVIAGREGPATAEIHDRIVEGDLGGSVDMIGYRPDVPDLMTAADAFVLPSRAEGSPGVLLEAMALEVPIVASDIPSVREVAGTLQPTMLLSPLGAPERLAAAIADLLGDRDAAAALATAARRRFLDNYTIDGIAERTMQLYGSLVAVD